MIRVFRRALRVLGGLLDLVGIGIYQKTKRRELNRFFKSLRPIGTEHGLTRVGPDKDGGYLLPNDLDSVSAIYSPGVAGVSDFEFHFAQQGIPCYLLDFSVESAPVDHPLFSFSKRFLGSSYLSHFVSLSSWLSETPENGHDAILQMDIEGGEWGVLNETPTDVLNRFRILVVEFHDFHRKVGNSETFPETLATFQRLLEWFHIVHIHANNCCGTRRVRLYPVPPVVEITFLRKDRVTSPQPTTGLPNILDVPNVAGKKDPRLPRPWR
jgi:hypothetical protein